MRRLLPTSHPHALFAVATVVALALPTPVRACHVIVHPGGPYEVECLAGPMTVALDGSQSNACGSGPLVYVWATDCPGATMDDATSVMPTMTLPGPGACGDACSVTLTVLDNRGRRSSESTTVTVVDTLAPIALVELAPLAPLPAQPASAPASSCSAPRRRDLAVACAVADACDPAPTVAAELVVTVCAAGGTTVDEVVDVLCGETVRIELDAARCPRRARSARPAASVDSRGILVVRGRAVRLDGASGDACGNVGATSFDPTLDAPSSCPDRTAAGCCPPLSP